MKLLSRSLQLILLVMYLLSGVCSADPKVQVNELPAGYRASIPLSTPTSSISIKDDKRHRVLSVLVADKSDHHKYRRLQLFSKKDYTFGKCKFFGISGTYAKKKKDSSIRAMVKVGEEQWIQIFLEPKISLKKARKILGKATIVK